MSFLIPNSFAEKTGSVQLSLLDDNFTYLTTSLDSLQTNIDNINLLQLSSTATGITGVNGILDNILPSGEVSGYALTTTGPGLYAWSALSAGNVTNVAAGNIVATTVQAAINELDSEKAATSSPTITTPTIATIKSAASNTLTAFQDSAGTPVGCLARAWANWDGTATGTITPRANFNMASITKTATGTYTGNFTNALPSANFAPAASNLPTSIANVTSATHTNAYSTGLTTSVAIVHRAGGNTSATPADVNQMSVIVFG